MCGVGGGGVGGKCSRPAKGAAIPDGPSPPVFHGGKEDENKR